MRGRVVVVGWGMVAHRLVEALSQRGVTAAYDVVVLAEERHPAYDRVHLSSCLTGGTTESLQLPAISDPEVEVRLGDPVVDIDREARVVRTRSGREESYDHLVLATGSVPFVPPVAGADTPGCFPYRTLDDLADIAGAARALPAGAPAVVVGGGLLGLEAAAALLALGVSTTVVELAPRLMPLQVDDGGGEALRRHVEALGVQLRLGTSLAEVAPNEGTGRVGHVVLSSGEQVPASLLVFAAGVRPRCDLAAEAGLELGPRGGVAVDEMCRTEDPRIWAVGECAHAAGRTWGLVGPGYTMAEVVADRLAGGRATFTGADTSTELKVLGVDVASVGDALGAQPGALELVYADMVSGVYKKLVVTDDGRRLLGAVLVGDVSSYAVLRALVSSGGELPGAPESLLVSAAPVGIDALPETALLCTCNTVSIGTIRDAVRCGDVSSVADAKTCTNAGTGCGSCVPMLRKLVDGELAACGREVSTAMCEHFAHSRQELYSLIRMRGLRTFSEVVQQLGTGRGCDVCKPTVASILATLAPAHPLDGENASTQDTNDFALANLQRDGTYSVVPRLPGGEVTPAKLHAIASVAEEFGLYTKITGGQRIDLFGARLEQLPSIWQRLVDAGMESGHAYGKALRTVKSCVGSTWCRFGVQDSVSLAIALELRYRGLRAPHKLKSAVSGCARECAEAQSKDFGVIATEQGWNLYVCGNGGFRPRHADLLATDLDTDTLVRYIDRFLMFYVRTADRLQRTSTWLESLDGGIDYLRSVVVDDSLGIADELEHDMARHVDGYADEWAKVLADPERLKHFTAFLNAPDMADPNVVHVVERGQPRPARGAERPPTEVLVAGPRIPVGAA